MRRTLMLAVLTRKDSAVPHASWPELTGDDLIQNGDMPSSSGWNQPTGSVTTGGKMVWTLVAQGDSATNDGATSSFIINNLEYIYNLSISSYPMSLVLAEKWLRLMKWCGNGRCWNRGKRQNPTCERGLNLFPSLTRRPLLRAITSHSLSSLPSVP